MQWLSPEEARASGVVDEIILAELEFPRVFLSFMRKGLQDAVKGRSIPLRLLEKNFGTGNRLYTDLPTVQAIMDEPSNKGNEYIRYLRWKLAQHFPERFGEPEELSEGFIMKHKRDFTLALDWEPRWKSSETNNEGEKENGTGK